MRDVYEAVYRQEQEREAKLEALTEEAQSERFDATEFLRRVEEESRLANAGLPRTERRQAIRAAVKRARKQIVRLREVKP